MQVKFSSKGTTLIVSISGELDHHASDHIRQKVDGEMVKATTKNVVFDFSKVSFMDSSGIGVIIGRFKNIQKLNGKIAVVNPGVQIKKIFEMSGMLKIIPVYDDLDTAIKMINSIAQ